MNESANTFVYLKGYILVTKRSEDSSEVGRDNAKLSVLHITFYAVNLLCYRYLRVGRSYHHFTALYRYLTIVEDRDSLVLARNHSSEAKCVKNRLSVYFDIHIVCYFVCAKLIIKFETTKELGKKNNPIFR